MKLIAHGLAILTLSSLLSAASIKSAEPMEVDLSTLEALPDYIILNEIAPKLSDQGISRLMRSSKRLYSLLEPVFAKRFDIIRYWSRQKIDSKELAEHIDPVNSVQFSPDGKMLASGSNDKTIRLWNIEDGKLIKQLTGYADRVNSIAFSPDGKLLASGSGDDTIRLWDTETGKSKTLTGHTDSVESVAFSPDGKLLASGSCDDTIRLWDVESGKTIKELTGHMSDVNSLAYSPDGKLLASGSSDRTLCLWDVETSKSINQLTEYADCVDSVAFSPDGKLLVSGSSDDTICLWRAKPAWPQRFELSTAIAFLLDDVILNEIAPRLSTKDLSHLMCTSKHFYGLLQPVFVRRVGLILCWVQHEIDSKELKKHKGPVYSVAFSPDSKLLASGSLDGTICLWNIETGKRVKQLIGHANSIFSVAFSPDGKLLASGSEDHTIRLWSVPSASRKRGLTVDSSDMPATKKLHAL